MPDAGDRSALEQIVDLFAKHGVEFVVIGGQAEALFGSPRVTYDVDLCYRRTTENLKRLAAAPKVLNPTLRGAPAPRRIRPTHPASEAHSLTDVAGPNSRWKDNLCCACSLSP